MTKHKGFKILGILAGGFVILISFLAAGGLFLPAEAEFADINIPLHASPHELFPLFNSRQGTQKMWSQGAHRMGIKSMTITDLGGPDEGTGTRLGFFLEDVGMGLAVRGYGLITESRLNKKVVIEIDFGMIKSIRTMELEDLGDNTTNVRWHEKLTFTNLLARYLPLIASSSANDGFTEVLKAAEQVVIENRKSVPVMPE